MPYIAVHVGAPTSLRNGGKTSPKSNKRPSTTAVMLLAEHPPGPQAAGGRDITGSRHANMKELRASKGGALRVLFAFDPRDTHLQELRDEGLLND
jgi:hypothetical protein